MNWLFTEILCDKLVQKAVYLECFVCVFFLGLFALMIAVYALIILIDPFLFY